MGIGVAADVRRLILKSQSIGTIRKLFRASLPRLLRHLLRRLEPQLQSFFRVAHGFCFGVARRGATGEFRKEGGPAFGFGIVFHDQSKFHAEENSLLSAAGQR